MVGWAAFEIMVLMRRDYVVGGNKSEQYVLSIQLYLFVEQALYVIYSGSSSP